MIIKVKKCLIYGIREEVDHFLHSAQKAGFIEFIHPSKRSQQLSSSIKDMMAAIKILRHYPQMQEKTGSYVSMEALSSHVVHLQSQLDQLMDESNELQKEISRIKPFGYFSREDIAYIEREAKRFIQFFCIQSEKKKQIRISDELIYINTDEGLDYYIAINKNKTFYSNLMEIWIDRPLEELESRLQMVQMLFKEKELEIKKTVPFLDDLRKELLRQLNCHNVENVKKSLSFPMEQPLFFIEAWIPVTHIQHFEKLISPFSIDYEYIAVEKHERVPTCMENKKTAKIGEDIVKIYDVPSIKDKDPSLWVFIFFAIFFAMIVSDAGYGLVYLLIALFAKWKIPNPRPHIRRFVQLMIILSGACIGWGVLTGSYFGMDVNPNQTLNGTIAINYLTEKKAAYHLQMRDDVYQYWQKEYSGVSQARSGRDFILSIEKEGNYEAFAAFKKNILLELSLLAGVIHIGLSFGRYVKRNWSGIGWILFLIGGYLFFPSMVDSTSMVNFLGLMSKEAATAIGQVLLYSGIGLAIILGIIQKRLMGLVEITNVIQIFSDVLSYLRLYALGLAAMVMAETFNDIAMKAGIAAGLLILILGHGLNLILGVMGGIIHGLRLNFIEWYHHSFEGDGKLFNPLRLFK